MIVCLNIFINTINSKFITNQIFEPSSVFYYFEQDRLKNIFPRLKYIHQSISTNKNNKLRNLDSLKKDKLIYVVVYTLVMIFLVG